MSKPVKVLIILLIAALLAVFAYAGIRLYRYGAQSVESQNKYDSLAALVQAARPTAPTLPDPTQPPVVPTSPLQTVTDPRTGEPVELLPEFAQAYSLNPDLVGWLSIADTNINYPVVQTAPDTPDYYLYRDFYGAQDSHGCIYAREQCDVFAPSDNVVIYGHRMKDHTMFGHLAKYERKDFWETHRYIRFDTLRQRQTYEIAYVFITTASQGEGFRYHTFVNARDDAEWEQFLSQCRQLSLYDTGVSVAPGDKLITLSTCEYTQENGRLVVVAKQVA